MKTIEEKLGSALRPGPVLARRVELQRVANVVHIRLRHDPLGLVVDPDLAHLFYTHDRTLGDEMRPHRLVWMAMFKRHPGETITIRLCAVTRPPKLPLSVLAAPRAAVPGAAPPKAGGLPPFTWAIRHDENAVETHPFIRTTDDHDRINLKYEVVFTSPVRTIPTLDPDINLIPDP